MKEITIWEGRRGPTKKLRRKKVIGGYLRSRRTAFGLRRKVTFTGELIGFWSGGHPFARLRGVEYSVYRTELGEIVIHRVQWSTRTTADDVGKFYIFSDLDSAAEKFGNVLKNAGVLH